MTGAWKPADYSDKFTSAIHALAKSRVAAGETEQLTPLEEAAADAPGSNVLDLTELLRQSLQKRAPAASAKSGKAAKTPVAKAPAGTRTAAAKAPRTKKAG